MLLKFVILLLVFVLYDSKLNIFGFLSIGLIVYGSLTEI